METSEPATLETASEYEEVEEEPEQVPEEKPKKKKPKLSIDTEEKEFEV